MRVVVAPSAGDAARLAAAFIAGQLREAIRERGMASVALSGGASPVPLFAALAELQLDWSKLQVFQVDERVAPAGDSARNVVSIEEALVHRGPLAREQLHAMPVDSPDLDVAASDYSREIVTAAGQPPVIDVIQLGLGADGHTASLFPGDPVVDATASRVAIVGPYAGYRRMTLTLPVINAARRVVWFVTGAAKASALAELVAGVTAAPAVRVARSQAIVFADGPAHASRP